MPTPKKGYFLADGTKVPGTTTIIGRFKDSGGLLQWAFKQGQSGAPSLYAERDRAADIGTQAHELVQRHLNGELPAALLHSDAAVEAKNAFRAYLNWAENFRIRVLEQEVQLVSEAYRFGGTPDAIAVVGNSLCLLDWKTSNGVYSDYLIQLAAYRHLWEVNRPDHPLTGGSHLLRFSKGSGSFAHHYYPDLSDAWRQFQLFREAYDLDQRIKSLV